MADEPQVVLNWQDAPEEFRAAYDKLIEENKANSARLSEVEREVSGVRREKAFQSALSEAKERLPEGVELTITDLPEDLPLEQITSTLLEVKAMDKKKAREEAEMAFAKDLGFETVEAYREFRALRDQAKNENMQGLAQNAAVSTVQNTAGTLNVEKTPKEQADEAYALAKKANRPEDECRAEYVRALREATPVGTPAQS